MKIKNEKIENIELATYNPRKINANEMQKLMDSLSEFGFLDPVIVNQNMTLIGGHQRIKAWAKLGNKTVPCIFVDLDPMKEKALNLALNKISGEWDNYKLNKILNEINSSEININLTGFDNDELKKLMGETKDLEIITGDNEEKNDLEIDYVPQANVKMLQLYFNEEEYKFVTSTCVELMEIYKLENITDVIKKVLENESERRKEIN